MLIERTLLNALLALVFGDCGVSANTHILFQAKPHSTLRAPIYMAENALDGERLLAARARDRVSSATRRVVAGSAVVNPLPTPKSSKTHAGRRGDRDGDIVVATFRLIYLVVC